MHDELRRLDEDLAAGRLDADSYRRRRDELLAARTIEPPPPSPPAAGPVESPGAAVVPDRVGAAGARPDEVGTGDPTSGEQATGDPAPGGPALDGPEPRPAGDVRDPFPPPFRWDGASSADGESDALADATQVVAASEDLPERTQVVRGGVGAPAGAADATQVVGRSRPHVPDARLAPPRHGPPAPPPERTQFVPGAALTRAGDLRSVPARRTVPPWVDERSSVPSDARRPGREVFARRRGPSPAAVIGTAALVLVVLVVLVLSFLLS